MVRKILTHLKLPTEPLPLLPARRAIEPELPFGPAPDAGNDERIDEPVDPSKLPAWMKVAPAGSWIRARGPADFEHVDEAVDVSTLPAWMRSEPRSRRSRAHGAKWAHRRHQRTTASDDGFWPDEDVDLSRLPRWMRGGSFLGPAPPSWAHVDAPGPGAEAFVDPIYEEPS